MLLKGIPKSEENTKHKSEPITRTLRPVVVGSSVVGLYYKDGVVLGFNNAATQYGSRKFDDIERHHIINKNTVMVASGEHSDFQYIASQMDQLQRREFIHDDNHEYGPRNYGKYLSQLCYQKRCKVNPYYIEGVVAGFKDGERYLGYSDLYGTYLENSYITTSFARYLCGHIIETSWTPDCDLETALNVMIECFSALFARNCPTNNSLQVVVINKDGIQTDKKKYFFYGLILLELKLSGIMKNSRTSIRSSLFSNF